jgi:ADP-heptose:LPS heptosyltransferase
LIETDKILIVRLSSFGDIVLSFPLINLLKRKNPSSHITFVVKEKYSELLRINPLIDEIIEVKDGELSDVKEHIAKNNFGLHIDLQNNTKSRYLTSPIKNVFRYRKNNIKKFLLVRFKINLLKEADPVYKKYIRSIENVLQLNQTDFEFTTSNLKTIPHPYPEDNYSLIAPSSRHFTKTYPKEKFVEFINSNPDRKFILVGDKSDTDMNICSYIDSAAGNTTNLCGKLNFSELSGIIAGAENVYCNDSGVLHLAEALGKNVTAIFGSTVREFGFFPQLSNSIVIENIGLRCRPCSHTGLPACPLKHFKCMKDISIM